MNLRVVMGRGDRLFVDSLYIRRIFYFLRAEKRKFP